MNILNEGRHHTVYTYGTDWVLKLPKPGNPIRKKEIAQRSVDFFNHHFSDFVPKNTYIEKWEGTPYAILQSRVHNAIHLGEYLCQTNNPNPRVLELLEEFLERCMNIIMESGVGFDIIGTPPQKNLAHLLLGCTNLLVTGAVSNDSNDVNLTFVDNVVGTKSVHIQNIVLNKIAFLIIPSRRKRLIEIKRYLGSVQKLKQFSL
ncbi:hypothetical protein HOO68_00395 [Candidatus Gracilibacteria bacterium]|nr:hypothetical protein [Candidatus Gracilibacteria bacterium]